MPVLKPQIQEALRQSGLLDPSEKEVGTSAALRDAGLGLPETLRTVEFIMNNGSSDSSKLRAAELSLKAHGLMKDQQSPIPSITIVINDPESKSNGINPILLPREMELPIQ